MCGIVGYIGSSHPIEVVLDGLTRLEYRGYDSAGISYVDDQNNIITHKKAGELNRLKEILPTIASAPRAAIGHTRWATHGEVNDVNAHPHLSTSWACVHNGIIENFSDLKEKLIERKSSFQSETDSEVFVKMLEMEDKNQTAIQSISHAFKKIDGNSAFVLLHKESSKIYALKKSAPLVLGKTLDQSQLMVSSDPYALVGRVEEIYFPEDNVICELSAKDGISFFELDGKPSKRFITKKQDASFKVSSKGEFEHYMLKEIYEQPGLMKNLFAHYKSGELKNNLEELRKLYQRKPFETIHMSACGTAYYAGLVVRDFFEKFNKIKVQCELASEFRYRNPIVRKDDLAMVLSQSGETADTLAALQLSKSLGLNTASILNVSGSSIYREVAHNFLIHAGAEIGVASTKAFTQMCLVGRIISAYLEGDEAFAALEKRLSLLGQRIQKLVEGVDEIKSIAESIYNYKGYFFTGRGIYYPIALEGALKLKEIAYVHAEGYAAGELKHGPLALIDHEMVNIAIIGPELHDKAFSNLKEIKSRKGIIVSIGDQDDKRLKAESNYFIGLDFSGLDELKPLYINVVNQLLAYYMAKFKGHDIDKPRNLAKSVTVE